jgi:peptidoglycan pentaglycine glycine transferase (the first glycine)
VSSAEKLITVTDRVTWNSAVTAAPRCDMLQSWEWGEFRESLGGWDATRLMLMREGAPVAGAQILARRVAGVPFLYAPRGPWWHDDAALSSLAGRLRRMYGMRAPFLRTDPLVKDAAVLTRLGMRRAPQQVQPRATIVVDLSRSTGDIISGFDRQVRYNANLATRKGVQIVEGGSELIGEFTQLLTATAERKGFIERSPDYYERFIATFGPMARVFVARHEGETIYGAVIAAFGSTAYYLYGASGGDRSVKPSELTQYRGMLWAKSLGATRYDMWGIPVTPTEDHPLYGTYRFKSGFGGQRLVWAGAYDLPLMPLLGSAAGVVESLALRSRSLTRGNGFKIVDHLA